MKKTLHDFCLETRKEGLLTQWDREENQPDTPKTISYGSRKQVWWVCGQGHTWKAKIYARTGCPICAGLYKKKRYRNVLEITPETEFE